MNISATEMKDKHQKLMALPVNNPERAKLRDRVRLTPAQLNSKTASWLTLATEYAERRAFAKLRADTLPSNVYPAWTRSKHCGQHWKLKYEGGDSFKIPGSLYSDAANATQSYVTEFERLNKLVSETA